MRQSSIIDIISPIMVGPSSSHTAGAVRLGLLARHVFNSHIRKIKFRLYNSYATTGKGHGTDKGLLSGILGLGVDDTRIKNIFGSDIAQHIEYSFEYMEDFNRHPNAVDFIIEGKDLKMTISGESIGAGEVVIRKINDFNVKITGHYNTLLILYKDSVGIISTVTTLIQKEHVNIASMSCDRSGKGQIASMCISLDGELNEKIVDVCQYIKHVHLVRYIKKLES
ncbi:MAG: L-serine ammonia-lyase, iron-sulfur-dependent subunit beta [Clostridiaceae bacterium]|jgi:L-serine dehydratase|nr:L-serine ammonia-lyase, iron-sulfur-dependent subunit beta [Clostridiaceae bacterium]